jgi:hypothetical protein
MGGNRPTLPVGSRPNLNVLFITGFAEKGSRPIEY